MSGGVVRTVILKVFLDGSTAILETWIGDARMPWSTLSRGRLLDYLERECGDVEVSWDVISWLPHTAVHARPDGTVLVAVTDEEEQ